MRRAAGDIEIDVMAGQPHAAMGFEHGKHHRQTTLIPADNGATRGAKCGRRYQRLDFDQDRTRAFDPGKNRGARTAKIAFRQKELGRVGDLAQPGARHFEHADLIGRAEAILDRAQNAELMRTFTFE